MRWTVGRKAVLGSLGALALATASASAVGLPESQGQPGRRHGGHLWGGPQRMGQALDLTEEQRASFKQLAEEHHKAVQPLRQQERELRQQIRQQLEGGNADATTIGQLTIQAHSIGKQLRESHAALMERFEGLLTPEQKAKLEEMKSQRGKRMERRERSGPRREKRGAAAQGAEL